MEITFKAKISNKGDQRIIWIPLRFHDQIKDFDKKQFKTTIKNKTKKIKFVSMILKNGSNRIVSIPSFLNKEIKKSSSDKSSIIITDIF